MRINEMIPKRDFSPYFKDEEKINVSEGEIPPHKSNEF